MSCLTKLWTICAVFLVTSQLGQCQDAMQYQMSVTETILPVCACSVACSTHNVSIPVIFPSKLDNYTDIYINEFTLIEDVTLQCDHGMIPVVIQPEDFFVVATGQLLHLTTNEAFESDQFCIEPAYDVLEATSWKLQLCMRPPRIPMCCSKDPTSPCGIPQIPMWTGTSQIIQSHVDISSTCAKETPVPSGLVAGQLTYLMYESYASILAADLANATNFTSFFTYHSQDEYCLTENITSLGHKTYEISYCQQDFVRDYDRLCENATCIHKCCPKGRLKDPENHICQEAHVDQLWRPTLTSHTDLTSMVDYPNNIRINDGPLYCKRDKYMVLSTDPVYYYLLLDNGQMYTPIDKTFTQQSHYCVDHVLNANGHVQEFALFCFPDEAEALGVCTRVKNYLIPTLLMVSCVFLAITLFVYAFIPELHAKLHGRSLLSHVAALLTAYFFLTMLRTISDALSMTFCRTFASITQMSFLAAFFWLNVMCFDIWWTLRSMRPVTEANDSTRRRFVYYSCYAWGFPIAIGMMTLGIEFLPQEQYPDLIVPGFGVSSCWFQNDAAKWVYLYSFILLLTILNIFFFICVTMILIQAQRANDSILRTPNLHHQERVWIYLKLFVVMGVTWVCEVISFQQKSCEYWFITDVINSLQGLFIFLIFICKKSVFQKLPFKKKKPLGLKKRGGASQGTSSYGSSSLSTQQTTLESSTRKLSSTLSYHISRLQRDSSNRMK